MADEHYFPRGSTEVSGNEVAADHPSNVHPTQIRMSNVNWPVLGVVTRIYYANSEHNKSQQAAPASSGIKRNITTASGYLKQLQAGTKQKGSQIECDVIIIEGLTGVTDIPILNNVPICSTFGGVEDYNMIIPKARNNYSSPYERGTGNGDYCIVQFIGGNIQYPIITGFYPHPKNTQDPAGVLDGKTAHFKFNGVRVLIDKNGDFYLDSRNANQEVTVGPESGIVKTHRTIGAHGKISVATKNDIIFSAGVPDVIGQENALPFGRATFAASKEVNIVSSKDDVKIQAPYKNLKKAARQFDSVKVNGGEVFEYLLKLKHTLFWVQHNMEEASKEVALLHPASPLDGSLYMVSAVLKEFLKQDLPKSAVGHITGGSNVCYIGSADFSALDIGHTALGLDDDLLAQIQEDCAKEKSVEVLEKLKAADEGIKTAKTISSLAGTIIPIVEQFEKLIPPLIPPGTAAALKIATKVGIDSQISGGATEDTSELEEKTTAAATANEGIPADEEGNLDLESPEAENLAEDLQAIIDMILNFGVGEVSEPEMSELESIGDVDVESADEKGGSLGGFYSSYTDCVNDKIEEELDK